jgi:MFS family permease
MSAALRRSVASLHVPNYRRFFAGQIVSVSGNWVQNVAAMWLVLHLTGEGTWVGLTAAMQFLPLLLFGAWGGLLADRFAKRRLLTITQTLLVLPPLALFVLVTTGHVEAWMVIALVFAGGVVTALDNPARQAFVSEIVGADRVVNAVSLNSLLVHSSRIAGPAVAAGVIALAGVGPCFLVNALSFGAMLVALRRMDPTQLHAPKPMVRARGQLREALRYVLGTPRLRLPLLMMAVIGTLSFNFTVLLPVLAKFTFHTGADGYAALSAALAVGSIAGALLMGSRTVVDERFLIVSATAFGGLTLLSAIAPTFPVIMVAFALVGAASVSFAAGTNSAVQLNSAPEMRGRAMALYGMLFIGSTAIGAPIVGWLADAVTPRAGLALGGAAAIMTAAFAARSVWADVLPAKPARA